MANIVPDAFKLELLSGTHDFASGGNEFYIALYVDDGHIKTEGIFSDKKAYPTNLETSSKRTKSFKII